MAARIGAERPDGDPAQSGRRHVRTVLPQARSVLAVVARPSDEACYLGAILEIYQRNGAEMGVLALTRGEASPYNDSLQRLDLIRPFELDSAASVLRIAHRAVVDYPETDLCRLATESLAEHVVRMVREWHVDLILTVDGRFEQRAAAAAACHAAHERGIAALAWTLPHEVAREVGRAGGLTGNGDAEQRIDFEVRVDRHRQWVAMSAHRSQYAAEAAHRARLAVQGDREWLRWLVVGVSRTAQEAVR
jgi:LmbE family N-acetylglucosaminyl deacetylase